MAGLISYNSVDIPLVKIRHENEFSVEIRRDMIHFHNQHLSDDVHSASCAATMLPFVCFIL